MTIEYRSIIRDLLSSHLDLHIADHDFELDLFEAGLIDSLSLVELINHIEHEFSLRLDLAELDINEFRTIGSLTAFVTRQLAATA